MLSEQTSGRDAQIMACDAGGTMTDVIVVDAAGHFTIGKASTTPHNQSLGYLESLCDGFAYWGIDFDAEAHRILPGVRASIPKVKPKLVRRALQGAEPAPAAIKGARQVYYGGQWQTATLYEMDALQPGNEIAGTAVIEAPSTTFFVPPGRRVRMDELSVLWLR